MASVKSDISLQIKNNLNRTATFSILGGTQDPSNGQANAKTIYEWDLTAETFANTTVVRIEASTIDNPTIINYEVSNQDGVITNLETVVRLLNTLNLGVFNLDGNTIWIIDDINVFGNIEVLISIGFDINVLVEDAYNYFDPLGKTTLLDFQTKYTSVIQHAVDTIPDFVDFVNTQGWSLCYPTNASEIEILRSDTRIIFIVTDTGGVLSTTEYASSPINETGFDSCLMYAPDVNAFKNIDNLLFQAPLLPTTDAFIYKYIFEVSVVINFYRNAPTSNNGFQFLDPSYFPSPTNFNFNRFDMPPFGTNQLDLYGLEFPKLNIQSGQYVISASTSSGDIDLLNVDGNVVFDTLGQGSRIYLNRLRESATNTIDVLFNTLTLIGDNQILNINTSTDVQQTINIDSDFNTKFNYGVGLSGDTLLIGCYAVLIGSIINYDDDITPLNLRFKEITFSNSITNNLPPIGTGGGQIGFTSGTDYNLILNLLDQNNLPSRGMEYFNNWFYELGTQDFLSQYTANAFGGFGTIRTASPLNSFVLSGQGYAGYHALLDCGFSLSTPIGAIKSNVFTFTINESALCLIRTQGVGVNSPFEVTSAQKNFAEVVTASVPNGSFEEINFPAPLDNPNNVIFTIDPTVNCTSFYIGTTSSLFDVMSTFICGKGIFNAGVDLGLFIINGLTITLPIYPSTTKGDAYGLFNRDFSGLNGNNVSTQLSIVRYKINITDIENNLVEPYGSNALFNIATNGVNPSIGKILFNLCQFGTSTPDTTFFPDPLGLLLPIGATCKDGIYFGDCTFNYANPPLIPNIIFNINDNGDTQQALLGTSTIENTTFGTFGNDRIQLTTNYNGTGDSISSLIFRTLPQLESVQLVNSATAIPPPCSLTFQNVVNLSQIIFRNYNMTNLNLFGGLPSVNNLLVNDNNLPSADLDDIIITLDNNGLTGGTLNYSNQTGGASPNIGVSGTAYNNLIAKGWTVTGNVPI